MQTRFSRFTPFIAWSLIALGIILRLRQYLANRSLWVDEAMLALNIVERNFGELVKPLSYNQGAPLGFLLFEKFVTVLLGNNNELRLRIIPLLAGCASLILFYLIVKRIFNSAGSLAALALFAISPTLIYYSSEVKQYSSDVFVTLLLLWLAVEIFYDGMTPKKRTALTIVGALSLWFSHPALFILTAIGLIILIQERKNIFPVLAMGAVWLASFAILYFVNLRSLSNNQFLADYWQEYFLPIPPNFTWLQEALERLFGSTAGLDKFAPALFIVAILGVIILVIWRWQIALSAVLPFIFVLATSALQKYPFAGRMMLFYTPLLFILLGACVDWVSKLSWHPKLIGPLAAFVLAGWMLYTPFSASFDQFITPGYTEHIRPAISYLQQNYEQGDTIYVYYWSVPAFRFYAPYYGFSESDFVAGKSSDLNNLLNELDQLKNHKRVWIIMSHLASSSAQKRNSVLNHLNDSGKQDDTFIKPGTGVFLYLYSFDNTP